MLHDRNHLAQLALHRLERRALVGLHAADQPAGVLLREEPFRDDHEQRDVQRHAQPPAPASPARCGAAPRPACAHTGPARARTGCAGCGAGPPAVGPSAASAAAARTSSAWWSARSPARPGSASDKRHREFAEQPPDDAAHQQDRDEHRDQRQADREDGEADLARARAAPPACRGTPSSIWRGMFSSTTIASSTTKPVATVSAISDRLSRL